MAQGLFFDRSPIRGLYRVDDVWLGEGVHVEGDTGDAAPFLKRDIYEILGGYPPFEALPVADFTGNSTCAVIDAPQS